MIDSIFDLLDVVPNPIPANSVPYFDGCSWKLIQMPEGIDCESLIACLSSEVITSFLSSSNGSITIDSNGNIEVNSNWINNNINSDWSGSILTIGNNSYDLSSMFSTSVFRNIDDGQTQYQVNNQATLDVAGADGMRFMIDNDPASPTYNNLIVGLPVESLVPAPYTGALIPGQRQHGQVLTWDSVNQVAYWANNNCCAPTIMFDPETEMLTISGGNSVYLGGLDNQELSLNGNLLSIEDGNTVDLSNVNNHSLSISGNQLTVSNSDGTHTSTVTLPSFDCDDVMACAGIQSIVSTLNSLTAQVASIEANIQNLWDAINGN